MIVHSGTAAVDLHAATRLFVMSAEETAAFTVGQILKINGDRWQIVTISGTEVRAVLLEGGVARSGRELMSLKQMMALTELLPPAAGTPSPPWPLTPPPDTPPPVPILEIPARVDLLIGELAAGRKINMATHQTAAEEAAWLAFKNVPLQINLATLMSGEMSDYGYTHGTIHTPKRHWFKFWERESA